MHASSFKDSIFISTAEFFFCIIQKGNFSYIVFFALWWTKWHHRRNFLCTSEDKLFANKPKTTLWGEKKFVSLPIVLWYSFYFGIGCTNSSGRGPSINAISNGIFMNFVILPWMAWGRRVSTKTDESVTNCVKFGRRGIVLLPRLNSLCDALMLRALSYAVSMVSLGFCAQHTHWLLAQ